MTDIVEFKENIKKTEELLKDSADRSQKIYQPVEGWIIEYPEFDKIVDQQMHTFWPHDEHKVSNDVDDLRVNATYAERESIIYCLMLFTHYELRVGDDYWINRIGKRFKRPEFQRMATMFAAVEMNSHAPFYNQANQVLYLDNEEFYSKWKMDDTLSARMEFISAVASSKDDLVSIAGFSLIEGAVLYSNFGFFKHFQAQECGKDLIKNFCRGINLSVGDENSHAVAGALLFRYLLKERNLTGDQKRALADVIYFAAKMIFEHENKIIDEIFSKGDIKGLTPKNLKDFVKHRIDLCLNNLGLKGLYEKDDKDGFIESWFYKNINSIQFHDFFTGGGSEYDSNWTKESFGRVFDPTTSDYVEFAKTKKFDKWNLEDFESYTVYTKSDCRFCKEVKQILSDSNIDFEEKEVNQSTRHKLFDLISSHTQVPKESVPKTVPQVFRNMKDGTSIYIGGGEDFVNDISSILV